MASSGYFGVNGYQTTASKNVYINPLYSNVRAVRYNDIQNADSFSYSTNSINEYLSEEYIKNTLKTNPEIKRILTGKGIPAEINMDNLKQIQTNHATDTQEISRGIIRHLPQSERYKIDTSAINQASYLHDIGKVFIPNEILNKPAMLESHEREIMQTHSDLGYEILKNSSLDERTKELVKYHHQNCLGKGYPKTNIDFTGDLELQILSTADKYSALTEHRPYKDSMSGDEALEIIYGDVQKNLIQPVIFRGLTEHLRKEKNSKIYILNS